MSKEFNEYDTSPRFLKKKKKHRSTARGGGNGDTCPYNESIYEVAVS